MPDPITDEAVSHGLMAQSLEASLTVADLARSAQWYRDVLGFSVDREFEREGRLLAVRLRAGAIRILLTQDDGARGAGRVRGDGFSLQITTTQDIDAVASKARQPLRPPSSRPS
jgi:catechol 2,3-dioxygenase-like lactoylglutathione lyase family enzyme